MEKKKLFIIIGILWLIIIIGFIGIREFTLRTGKEILLKTVPVDPRDLFRGDYVILDYEISHLDLNKMPADHTDFKVRDKVYLSLSQENGYGVPAKVYRNVPQQEKLFIKGKVKKVYDKYLIVEYGIESYFVPEGKGKELERATGRDLAVKVSIDRFGNAAIKSLLLDGQEVSFK
ncbi:MAG: GDYXXLXY domain-containing protein [Candidatus Margulisiibacteriota bacterium]